MKWALCCTAVREGAAGNRHVRATEPVEDGHRPGTQPQRARHGTAAGEVRQDASRQEQDVQRRRTVSQGKSPR